MANRTELPAVWICWDAIKTVANAVAIHIAVPPVSDAVAVKIAVRTIQARLLPLMAWPTPFKDIGDAIPVAVRAAALPVWSAMALTLVKTPMVAGCRSINRPGLHMRRCRLHIKAGHLHPDRKSHIAAGVRRRSRCKSTQCERDGGK